MVDDVARATQPPSRARRTTARYGALRFTIVAVWGGALALLPAAAGLPATVRAAPASATRAVLYLAVVPGALGYAAWAYVIARASSAAAGSALYLIPAVSMVLSHLLLGEVPSGLALAGRRRAPASLCKKDEARAGPERRGTEARQSPLRAHFASTRERLCTPGPTLPDSRS